MHLVVVGGDLEMIRAELTRGPVSALASRAHFIGAQPDPRPWLHAADVLAMPSAYESYGLVVLEALACGVPVVATATGCVPDVVVDGVNGTIVVGTPGDIAAGLQRALACLPPPRGGRHAPRPFEHSWDEVARRYLAVMTMPGVESGDE